MPLDAVALAVERPVVGDGLFSGSSWAGVGRQRRPTAAMPRSASAVRKGLLSWPHRQLGTLPHEKPALADGSNSKRLPQKLSKGSSAVGDHEGSRFGMQVPATLPCTGTMTAAGTMAASFTTLGDTIACHRTWTLLRIDCARQGPARPSAYCKPNKADDTKQVVRCRSN